MAGQPAAGVERKSERSGVERRSERPGVERRSERPGVERTSERSTASLAKDVVTGTQTLVRHELQLARAELMEGLTAKGQAAGMAGAAGMLGLFVIGFLGLAGGAALDLVLPTWAAWLIVAGVYLVLLAVLLLVARSKAGSAPLAPEKTKARLQEDVTWAKTLMKR